MTATSTTYGSSFLFDSLVLEAQAMRVLDPEVNPLQSDGLTPVLTNHAEMKKGVRRIEMSLYQQGGVTGFTLRVYTGDYILLSIMSPGMSCSGRLRSSWKIYRGFQFPPWFKSVCSASAIEEFYDGTQKDMFQLIPESERSDPQSKFMECFLMNLLKELAR